MRTAKTVNSSQLVRMFSGLSQPTLLTLAQRLSAVRYQHLAALHPKCSQACATSCRLRPSCTTVPCCVMSTKRLCRVRPDAWTNETAIRCVVVCDQLYANHLGFVGTPVVQTSNFDASAARRSVVDRVNVNNPVCMSNRSLIWLVATKVLTSLGLLAWFGCSRSAVRWERLCQRGIWSPDAHRVRSRVNHHRRSCGARPLGTAIRYHRYLSWPR